MRLDKYLKLARILKRRTISNEIAKQSKVMVNGKVAKPATQVKPTDIITIQFGNRILTIRVLSITITKDKQGDLMYEIIESDYIKREE